MVQRVSRASVRVDGKTVGNIGPGLVIFLGIGKEDEKADLQWGARKVAELRIFQDENDKMNRSLLDIAGEALVISQFTLYGDAQKGRRPSFVDAAPPEQAQPMYDQFVRHLKEYGIEASTGVFAARMSVDMVNEGPVTILIER